MNRIKIFVQSHHFIFVCFFMLTCVLMIPDHVRPGTDDTAWIGEIDKQGIFSWVATRAAEWQPRLFSDFCIAFFVRHISLWKLVNAAFLTVLLYSIDKIVTIRPVSRQSHRRISLCVIAAFFLVFPYVLTSSVFWFAGSFYYLWPVTLAITALIPFFRACLGEEAYLKKIFMPLFFLCAILGGYMEQTAALMICFSAFTLIFLLIRKQHIPVALWAQFGVMLLNVAVFLYKTFTSPRVIDQSKELQYLPGYENLSGVDKLFLGVNVTNNHLITSSNLLLLALALLAGYAVYRRLSDVIPKNARERVPGNPGNQRAWSYLAFVPAGYISLSVLPFRALMSGVWQNTPMNVEHTGHVMASDYDGLGIFDIIYSAYPLDGVPSGLFDYCPMLLAMFMMVFLAVLIFLAFREPAERFVSVALYLASLASGYIIGFSPTVFATASRAFFQTNALIVLIVVMIAARFIRNAPEKIRAGVKIAVFAFVVLIVHIILLYWDIFSSADWIY